MIERPSEGIAGHLAEWRELVVSLVLRTFRVYAANFQVLVCVSIIWCYVPATAIDLALCIGDDLPDGIRLGLDLANALLPVLIMPLMVGGAAWVLEQNCLGNQVTASAAVVQSLRRLPGLYGATLSVGLWTVVGLLILVVPGALWCLSYALVIPVAMIEPGADALTRSRELVRDRGLVAIFCLMMFSITMIVMVPWALLFWPKISFVGLVAHSDALPLVLGEWGWTLIAPLLATANVVLFQHFRLTKATCPT